MFFRSAAHHWIGCVAVIAIVLLGAGALMSGAGQSANRQTQWATYAVDLSDVSALGSGEYFTFQYPKSEYVELNPDMTGRLLRLQNYDPYTTTRNPDGRYWLEFFVDTREPATCDRYVTNARVVANAQGLTMHQGVAPKTEESGTVLADLAVCVERAGYVLYMQGSDYTQAGVIEQITDSIQYRN